ncbi:hypothetical protein ABZP36_008318 [Zizania latifolia]
MKFLVTYKAQVAERIVAWKGPDDPSTGEFSISGDPNSNFQIIIWHGTRKYRRSILLDGVKVNGRAYESNTTSIMFQTEVITEDEFYVLFTTSDGSPYLRVTLDYMGIISLWHWNTESSSWAVLAQSQVDCARYASCGPFGYCDFTSVTPRCQCLDGFEPDGSNSSRGCRRKQDLKCGDGNHFLNLPGMIVPDKFLHIRNRSFDECAAECSSNCSCTAYTYANLTGDGTMGNLSKCLLWTGELVDTGKVTSGQNLYLRLADVPSMLTFPPCSDTATVR